MLTYVLLKRWNGTLVTYLWRFLFPPPSRGILNQNIDKICGASIAKEIDLAASPST
jgi:hypothetical protein